ncbi:DUF4349 domain-containing protein [Spongiactinospora gelatinilytica]|nr:DUF4349 domain-containing protein [Spongiactinospora gelatinilytica]
MSRIQHGLRLGVPLAALLLLGTACGGGGGGTAQSTSERADAPAALTSEDRYGKSESDITAKKPQSATDEESGRDTSGKIELIKAERAVIYVSEMGVKVKDVPAAAEKAKQIVTAAQGHLSKEESDSFGKRDASARLEFKVPPPAYPGVLARLGKELGDRESLRQGTEDVTEEVADVESRLASSKSALESLRALLKRADTIGEVLQVEREINEREADLESLQARQKSLAERTSMGTITLHLFGPASSAPKRADDPSGFAAGLRSGWHGLADFVKVVLTLVGVLVPWLIVIVPPAAGLVFLVRRSRRRHAPPPAVETGEPAVS